jgi:predicted nucleic acid-binding protein
MKRVFGDAHYFLALANPRDTDHRAALEFARQWRGVVVTTRWILAEVADGLAAPLNRRLGVMLVEQVSREPRFRLVENSDGLCARGFDLYRCRADKEWSLTDCISFVVMADEGLTDALTVDRHFAQAGFTALLAR